jgi:hypothetical protein
MNNFAILKPESPFFPVFEGGRVPIKNIVLPTKAECIGDGVQEVYMVDLEKLTPHQWDTVSRMVHNACDPKSDLHQAQAEMVTRGLPLRAKHVQSVTSDVPFFL